MIMSKKSVKTYSKSFSNKIAISNANLQKILKFYLFECPVPGKSVRGRTFQDYGISGSAAFSRLKTNMLKEASSSLRENYKPSTKNELDINFSLMNSIIPPDEYCVFLKYDEKRVMQSLFSAIRNAFAHGSFYVKKYYGTRIYFLANYDGYLKAEIVLHETTLLNWINCIVKF